MVKDNNIDLKKKQVLIALEKNLGNISLSCKSVGIGRTTFYQWAKDDKDFKQYVDDIDEMSVDFGESCLKQQMKKGCSSSTIFFLKCKGKNRGYIERTEVDNNHTFVGGKPEEYED